MTFQPLVILSSAIAVLAVYQAMCHVVFRDCYQPIMSSTVRQVGQLAILLHGGFIVLDVLLHFWC